jgi:hypothetical protein
MGNISSHEDLTSWRREHQAKRAAAVAFQHPPHDEAAPQGGGHREFAGDLGISQQEPDRGASRDVSLDDT